MMTPYITTPR